jgi:1-acyl-sn-glycerol-3-phosphate acyltransferase
MPKKQRSRRIPLVEEIALITLTLFFAFLHMVSSPFGKDVESAIYLLAFGGFFCFALLPVPFFYGILYVFDDVLKWCDKPTLLCWGVGPFSVLYLLDLLFDTTHLQSLDAGPLPHRYWLEQMAWEACESWKDYVPRFECIPWDNHARLDPTAQYIFCLHPHGIHSFALAAFHTKSSCFHQCFPGLYNSKLCGLGATVLFKIPVVREMFFKLGYIDARRTVASKALENGQSLYLVPGGEEESLRTTNGKDIVVLKERKGFIRLALSYGIPLVPVFAVGCTDAYKTYPNILWGPRRFLQKKLGIALPIFHGRWFFTPLAYPVPIKLLVGEPIETPKPKVLGSRPSDTQVQEYHAKYVNALAQMHAKHVHDRTLEIY